MFGFKAKRATKVVPKSLEAIEKLAPKKADGPVTFPKSDEARLNASKQFRRGVLQLLQQAIEGGINKTIVEVSAVREQLVDEVKSELTDLGYTVYFEHQVKVSKGYTSRQMVVKYE